MANTDNAPDRPEEIDVEIDVGDIPEEFRDTGEPADDTDVRIAELEGALAIAKDQHLRALAETENVRRRGLQEVEKARNFAVERFAQDLLSVADNMARALTVIPAERDEALAGFITGVELTGKELYAVFARHGLEKVAGEGAAFDPNVHQAVAQIPSNVPAGAVAQVFQDGWTLKGRLVRQAMVAVSAGAPKAPPAEAEAPE
jgi:molecular chaperone GrpE